MPQDNSYQLDIFRPQTDEIDDSLLHPLDEVMEVMGYENHIAALNNLPVLAAHISSSRYMQGAILYAWAASLLIDADPRVLPFETNETGEAVARQREPKEIKLDKRLSEGALSWLMFGVQATLNVMNRHNLVLNAFNTMNITKDFPALQNAQGEYFGPAALAAEIDDERLYLLDTHTDTTSATTQHQSIVDKIKGALTNAQ